MPALTPLVAGCSQASEPSSQTSAPTAAQIISAEKAVPADPALRAIYERSCRACHATPDSKAPLTQHSAAWAPLIASKGIDGLIKSAKHGVNAMPPMGQCPDCSDDQLEALITFMAEGSM